MSSLANISSKDYIRLIPVCNWLSVKSVFVISSWSKIDVVDDDSVDWWCIVTGWTSQSTALGGMVIVFVVALVAIAHMTLWVRWAKNAVKKPVTIKPSSTVQILGYTDKAHIGVIALLSSNLYNFNTFRLIFQKL
jgi:hypothetical protein